MNTLAQQINGNTADVAGKNGGGTQFQNGQFTPGSTPEPGLGQNNPADPSATGAKDNGRPGEEEEEEEGVILPTIEQQDGNGSTKEQQDGNGPTEEQQKEVKRILEYGKKKMYRATLKLPSHGEVPLADAVQNFRELGYLLHPVCNKTDGAQFAFNSKCIYHFRR
jgi:hypothetical protein